MEAMSCFARAPRRKWRGAVTAVLGLMAGIALAADAPPMPESLNLYAGQAVVHSVTGSIKRVAVGSGDLLDVKVLGTHEVVMIANQPGDTSVQLWMTDGSQKTVPVHVVQGNTAQVAEAVRSIMGDVSSLGVNEVGGNVVVTGNNLSSGDMDKLAQLKKVYPQILVFASPNAVEMRPTVLMETRIMEFDKKTMDEIGIQWDTQINGPSGGLIRDWKTNPYFNVRPDQFAGIGNLSGTQSYFGIATSITSRINLAMQTGNAWELATPQLSARSGGAADFLVGGEVPVATTSGFGNVDVEYKPYGIKMHIEPIVSASGDISAKIETEISKIDPTITVLGNPAFLTRRTNTEMNVHEGQTIVLSGLVDANATKTFDKVPGLGQIPVLGALFRSRNFQANRTELVIFVTPHVIDPESERNRALVDRSEQLKNDLRQTAGADIVD
ncbi:type II and III secretion system protein family protein [Luteibacter yeojuensis]|uniref:Type II and III secretion system protein n=1 Tax=Luteibacter yeojuensis TaxID=345309 RepID=A0A7X5QRJ2_9GAMM|nr:pilus assembly protein N-terminal domain-containing protein [Luteibacter yeojuensis]NID13992.1 type II and III secretion system protein [Luteibacter yeojuensis]